MRMMRMVGGGWWLAVAVSVTSCAPSGGPPEEEGSDAELAPVASDPDALVGAWRLLSIEPAQGDPVTPTPDATPTLTFTAEADPTGSRTFNGSNGCNRISGSYDAGTSGRIAFSSPMATTLMACPEPVADVERAFMRGLEGVRTYAVEGDVLSLDFGDGTLRFERGSG